ncbi:MAG: UDP-N-acetylmuramoyl-L-alanyl-D-glutamate--2,6-diaminopimelate ligase [Gemmatimonadales bacterium]|nr:MAG: UDP-N-acetylmuramoyl-L-alanyl-D-glutamate--2,6-diaminopimelate ligase [Gemmatimonadales bacterium]
MSRPGIRTTIRRIRAKTPDELRAILFRTLRDRTYEVTRRTGTGGLLARLSSAAHGFPSRHLRLVGVTGTNGKGCTAHFIREALERHGIAAGLIGTNGVRIGDEEIYFGLTTPAPLELHQYLNRMRRAGAEVCAMEVSSHALEEGRVDGLGFHTGVFTRLAPDHLDYHGSFEAYRDAKAKLFRRLPPGGVAVLNRDDPASEQMAAATRARVIWFGDSGAGPDAQGASGSVDGSACTFRLVSSGFDGLVLEVDGVRVTSPAVGEFNAWNLTAAFAALRAQGLEPEACGKALSGLAPLRGRLEAVVPPHGANAADLPRVLVDFARSPDALRCSLEAVRRLAGPGVRVVCVFSSCGDRDPAKRPEMGSIAESLADECIITVSNPRNESPEEMLAQKLEGFSTPSRARLIPDRREAIRAAILDHGPESVILIAGKGHESRQEVQGRRLSWSDELVAREAMALRLGLEPPPGAERLMMPIH